MLSIFCSGQERGDYDERARAYQKAIAETSRVHEAKDVFIKVRKENLHDPHIEERWHYIYHFFVFLFSCEEGQH